MNYSFLYKGFIYIYLELLKNLKIFLCTANKSIVQWFGIAGGCWAGSTPCNMRAVGMRNWYRGSPGAEHAGLFATPAPTSWDPFQSKIKIVFLLSVITVNCNFWGRMQCPCSKWHYPYRVCYRVSLKASEYHWDESRNFFVDFYYKHNLYLSRII